MMLTKVTELRCNIAQSKPNTKWRGFFKSLPANLQGGLCGVHCPREAGVLSDVGQGHHTVVVGDQDDINGGQIQQFFLLLI